MVTWLSHRRLTFLKTVAYGCLTTWGRPLLAFPILITRVVPLSFPATWSSR